MGLIVTSKSYTDQSGRSGAAFLGNVLDKTTVQYSLKLSLRLDLKVKNPIYLDASTNTLTLTSGNWKSLIGAFGESSVGAGDGATIDLKLSSSPAVVSTTVISVFGADMVVASVGGFSTGDKTTGYIQVTSIPKDFEVSYNLVPNNVGAGTGSLIDGEAIRFRGEDIDLLTTGGTSTKVLTQLGNKSGGSIFDNALLTITANAPNPEYTLDLQYKIWTCLDSSPFVSSNAVGDYAELSMLMISGDPSTAVTSASFQTGNTGYENENFNGGTPEYTLGSIGWQDGSSNNMTAFDFTQQSEFTIVINGDFKPADKFTFKMFTIPNDASLYQNKPLPLDNNIMLVQNATPISPSTPTNVSGNANENGAKVNILNLESTIVPGVSMTITGVVDPNIAFTNLFNSRQANDRKYKILVSTEDSGILDYSKSNRVNILTEFKDAKKNLTPLGKLTTVTTLDMLDHADDVYVGLPELYLEDDVLVVVEYTLPKDNTSTPVNPWIAIKGRIVIENVSTFERYTLEELLYNVSSLPVLSDGSLPLNYTENRGFKLPDTSNKVEFVIEREPLLDSPDVFGVRMKYPFIVRYEDWQLLQNVPTDFYSTPNSNWYNFASDPNWIIKFEHAAQIDNGIVQGEYIDDIKFNVNTYDDWGESPGSSISFEREDGTPIVKPSSTNISVVKAVHELTSDTWTGNEYVQIHVRPKKNAPQWTGSTVLDWSDPSNPIYPLIGETKTTLDIVGGTITSEVRFDPSKVDFSQGLTFTTRVKGDSTGGKKNNIYLLDTQVSKKPFVPGIGDVTDAEIIADCEENRGILGCCPIEKKFASLEKSDRKYNCITGVVLIADQYIVVLKKDGVETTSYTAPTPTPLPNDPDALLVHIEWRQVAQLEGFGHYTIEIQGYFLNSVLESSFVWGEYELKPYYSDGIYNREGTARIYSRFDDMSDLLGIDFTGSNFYDSLIVDGKFGYNEPNTEVDNVVYLDGRVEKKKREDFDTWELRVDLTSQYFIDRLRFHILGENDTFLSDNNATSPSYRLFDRPVIISEGYSPEYFDGSRLQKGVVKFEDKTRNKRTHFNNNRNTADTPILPPVSDVETVPTGISSLSLPTGQTVVYATGDDGFYKFGRLADFFTLPSGNPNPYGGFDRFTDTDGLQVYGNGLVCDWAQWDTNTGDFVMYKNTVNGIDINWHDAIAEAQTLNIDGFTGFRVMDDMRQEAISCKAFAGISSMLNYSPFAMVFVRLWSATSQSIANATEIQNDNTRFSAPKTTSSLRRYGAYRVGNVSELNI